MLVSLNAIATEQAHANTIAMGDIVWLLNYAVTHPVATLHYNASDMILHIASDVSYICEERACSQAVGHLSLADRLVNNVNKPPTLPTNNGAIHTLCQLIKTVMSSASKAEICATFINAKDALPIHTTLKELGHPQPPTPMKVDNTTSVGFANNTIKQKRSKEINMHFYWIVDCSCQSHFRIYWGPGITNLGNYHTKHHSPGHHQLMRPHFLNNEPHVHLSNLLVMHIIQGCVNFCRMREVCAEQVINVRRHITSVNPLQPVILDVHDNKLINNVFLSYDCHYLAEKCLAQMKFSSMWGVLLVLKDQQ